MNYYSRYLDRKKKNIYIVDYRGLKMKLKLLQLIMCTFHQIKNSSFSYCMDIIAILY
jgi:hypothetical protein